MDGEPVRRTWSVCFDIGFVPWWLDVISISASNCLDLEAVSFMSLSSKSFGRGLWAIDSISLLLSFMFAACCKFIYGWVSAGLPVTRTVKRYWRGSQVEVRFGTVLVSKEVVSWDRSVCLDWLCGFLVPVLLFFSFSIILKERFSRAFWQRKYDKWSN